MACNPNHGLVLPAGTTGAAFEAADAIPGDAFVADVEGEEAAGDGGDDGGGERK